MLKYYALITSERNNPKLYPSITVTHIHEITAYVKHIYNGKTRRNIPSTITKPVKDNIVLIIHQAHYIEIVYPEHKELGESMLKRDTEIFTKLGISLENISYYDAKTKEKPDLSNIDVLLVQGGNNFYYLQQIRENGYMEDIRDFIEKGGVYVGSSAGSMMMGQCVDVNFTMDENLVGLDNLTGFGLVSFYLVPHWDSKDDELRVNMLTYGKETGKQVIALTDQQGVLVTDKEYKVI